MQLDFVGRELTIKLVYYGPALSGKTTNLQSLHKTISGDSAGRLMTLETKDDRTLFFDLLPLTFRGKGDVSVRVKVFTVPGQVIHTSTRRLVVQGADGVIFVADSQLSESDNNGASFVDLKQNLRASGVALDQLPLVIQFNKRDMPKVRTEKEISDLAMKGREPVYLASALTGEGVVESFMGALALTWARLEREHELRRKFQLEADGLLDEICEKLGSRCGVQQVVSSCIGGAMQFSRLQERR